MIEKEFGFIYLEKKEIAYYMASLWKSELFIQFTKNKKYSKEKIDKFHSELWKLINHRWNRISTFRLTRKGKTQDYILSQACSRSAIRYKDLPNEFSVFRPKSYAIEWRRQLHPCKFHKTNQDDINRFKDIREL